MRQKEFFWGGLLILLGGLFLLDNFGVFDINVWSLLWPLLIIALGVQLLLGSRMRRGQAETEQVVIPIKGIESARVRVNYGAGELHIYGHDDPDDLMDGSFGAGLEYDLKAKGRGADLRMKPLSNTFPFLPFHGEQNGRNWSFGLNRSIPLSLDVNTGASKAVLNLEELNLTELNLKTGASETFVTLPAHAAHAKVRSETGMAAVTFDIPDGVAARIHTSGGLSEIRVDESRFPRRGSGYESEGYETAEHQVELHLQVGLGSAKIR